jgi:hypothetical protein
MAFPPQRVSRIAATLLFFGILLPAYAEGGPKPKRPGDPVLSFPLDHLGFEQVQPRLLLGGATMFTLNFVDDTHLLLTFNSHGLIPRAADGRNQDGDRLVQALLIELPSGKVLAKTTWHTLDREQYLWPLSHGLFLLRIGNRLTVIDPLRSLGASDPFEQRKFLDISRRIGYISLSPGGDLLVIETIQPPRQEQDDSASVAAGPRLQFSSVPEAEINFYRMLFEPEDGRQNGRPHLIAQGAGMVTARNLIRVPATSEGFLDMKKESPQTWLFDFQSHAGKRLELAPFDTTCSPNPYFVSRTDFVAFGCHGSANRIAFGGFNLRGEQPWVQILSGPQVAPSFVSAPAAGRFAFSHVLVGASFADIDNLSPDDLNGQEVMVIQNHDGRILLKVQPSPVQRTGQNFDLSPDGLNFTTLRNGNLEVYRLPDLTPKDQEQLKLAAADEPEKNIARIRLTPDRPPDAAPPSAPSKALTVGGSAPVAPAPANTGGLDLSDPATAKSPAPAPPVDDTPRPPPSLYSPEHPKQPEL